MGSDGSFAFLLPFIFFTFGGLFLLVSRWDAPAATRWGTGYFASAAAFMMPTAFPDLPVEWHALAADLLFMIAAYCYSDALFLHFGRSRFRAIRIVFAAAMYAATAYAILVEGSLHAELLLGDIAFGALVAFPLPFVFRLTRHGIQKLLLVMALLAVLDCVIRNVLFVFVVPSDDGLASFASSTYAYAMQATAAMLGILLALTAIAAVVLDAISNYRAAAERDPLTGLLNRRGFERAVPSLENGSLDMSVVIVADIDHFKAVNDAFGHAKGDLVLSAFAEILGNFLPAKAAVSRFGGEEFVAYVPDVTVADGERLANMLRLVLENRQWTEIGIDRKITASFGIGRPEASDLSIHDAIARADIALYAAKSAGRNRVVSDGKPEPRLVPLSIASVA